jgi:hypothetical protein
MIPREPSSRQFGVRVVPRRFIDGSDVDLKHVLFGTAPFPLGTLQCMGFEKETR